MTRCYEFYCMVLKNPEFCEGKGDRIVDYINKYINFMQGKGVKFDKSQTDKALFHHMVNTYGSEGAVTRTHICAEGLSSFSISKQKISPIKGSLPKQNVKSCPDGVCATTPQEFVELARTTYPFPNCLCKTCIFHEKCYGAPKI